MTRRSNGGDAVPGVALLAQRSELLGVEPIGLGTPLAEHAASRIARTAWRNRISPARALRGVTARVVTELAQAQGDDLTATRWIEYLTAQHAHGIYGTGRVAATVVDALERVTRREGWRSQTLLDLAAVLPSHELLEPRRRTCWRCVDAWRSEGLQLYEPLLWQIRPVVVCHVHDEPLRRECPACGRERWPLTGSTLPGYCDCGAGLWLPSTSVPTWTDEERDWYRWVADEMGEVVAHLATLGAPAPSDGMGEAILLAARRTGPTFTGFARSLGVALSTVSLWKDGRRTPPLTLQLRICRVAGFRVVDFLLGDLERLEASAVPPATPWLPPRTRRYQRHPAQTVVSALEAALDGEPTSLSEVARSLGMNRSFLHRAHPDLARRVSDRYRADRVRLALERRARYEAEIVAAVRAVHEEGRFPALHRVRQRVSGVVGRRLLVEVWQRETRALGYRRCACRSAPR